LLNEPGDGDRVGGLGRGGRGDAVEGLEASCM
jgi:hypothetical protein